MKMDLNLLLVADSLFRTGNVSVSAKELGLSQSAVSHALARLRTHYGDPLFVRISRGVAPTEFAKSLRSEISDFAARSLEVTRRSEAFDPLRASGRVTIATTDYFEVAFLPRILALLRKEAPGIHLSIRNIQGQLPTKGLENGSVDLAVAGFFENLPEGHFQAALFKDGFSVAMRKNHPLAKGRLSVGDYFDADHVLITLQGDFEDDVTAKIDGRTRHRRIVFGSSSFTAPAWTVSTTDLLLTAPTRLLEAYGQRFPVVIRDCPARIDPIEIRMVWHGLSHRDPMKKWFRERLRGICAA